MVLEGFVLLRLSGTRHRGPRIRWASCRTAWKPTNSEKLVENFEVSEDVSNNEIPIESVKEAVSADFRRMFLH